MKKKNLTFNMLINVTRTLTTLLFPLITYPYSLRVLGVDVTGRVNYTASIISYFVLFASLGFEQYAVREGAKVRNDPEKFNRFINQMFTLMLAQTLLAYGALIAFVAVVPAMHSYVLLLAIQSITIMTGTFNFAWINTVQEDFLIITVRAILCNLVGLILLVTLIHSQEDYYLYAFLQVFINILISVSNWLYLRKKIRIRLTWNVEYRKHMPKVFVLFAARISQSIYVNSDITMLGAMQGENEVGVYSAATKIYSVAKRVLWAISGVTIPRLASNYGEGNMAEFRKNIAYTTAVTLLLVGPFSIGLSCVAPEIILLMAGVEYQKAGLLLTILAPGLLLIGLSRVIWDCIYIVIGREKEYAVACAYSAGINFGLNIILIPLISYYGAAITTVISETFMALYGYARLENKAQYFDFEDIRKNAFHASIGIGSIILVTNAVRLVISVPLYYLIVSISISVVVYFAEMVLLQNELVLQTSKQVTGKFKAYLSRR